MKQFRFKLAPVLRYRAYKMRIELMKLARAKQELFSAQETIRGIRERKLAVSETLVTEQSRGMDGGRYHLYRAYLDGLNKELADSEKRRLAIAQHVSERHQAVEAERIRKETLERLKEERKKDYVRSAERMEQKEADELVGLRFGNTFGL